MNSRFLVALLAVPTLCAAYPGSDPYYRAVLRVQRDEKLGTAWDARTFSSLDWVGRTAVLNHSCQDWKDAQECRSAIILGLTDKALLVRDHALRLALHGAAFDDAAKRGFAEQVLADARNYRQGFGLWIVDRAKEHLSPSQRVETKQAP